MRACVCVCGRWWHIHIHQFIPYYASVYTQTHTRILKPSEVSEPMEPKVDTARYKEAGWAKGWRGRYLHQNKKLYSVSTHKYGERHTEHSVHNSRENASLKSVDASLCVNGGGQCSLNSVLNVPGEHSTQDTIPAATMHSQKLLRCHDEIQFLPILH